MKKRRLLLARLFMWAYLSMYAVSSTLAKVDKEFLECLDEAELEKLGKLKQMTHKLADQYRSFGWVLEGYDSKFGPPRRATK